MRINVCWKSVNNANELAQVLSQCLSVECGVRGRSLLAAMRDGARVKQAAVERVAFIFPKMLNVVLRGTSSSLQLLLFTLLVLLASVLASAKPAWLNFGLHRGPTYS